MIYMGLYRSYPFQRQRIRHRPKLPGLLESLNGFRGSLIQSQKAILSQLDSELEKVRSRNDENNKSPCWLHMIYFYAIIK